MEAKNQTKIAFSFGLFEATFESFYNARVWIAEGATQQLDTGSPRLRFYIFQPLSDPYTCDIRKHTR